MIDDIPDLFHQTVLKQPYPDTAGAQGGHFGPQSFGAVGPDHGHLVARL